MLKNTNIGGSLLVIKFFFMVVIYNRKKARNLTTLDFGPFIIIL